MRQKVALIPIAIAHFRMRNQTGCARREVAIRTSRLNVSNADTCSALDEGDRKKRWRDGASVCLAQAILTLRRTDTESLSGLTLQTNALLLVIAMGLEWVAAGAASSPIHWLAPTENRPTPPRISMAVRFHGFGSVIEQPFFFTCESFEPQRRPRAIDSGATRTAGFRGPRNIRISSHFPVNGGVTLLVKRLSELTDPVGTRCDGRAKPRAPLRTGPTSCRFSYLKKRTF